MERKKKSVSRISINGRSLIEICILRIEICPYFLYNLDVYKMWTPGQLDSCKWICKWIGLSRLLPCLNELVQRNFVTSNTKLMLFLTIKFYSLPIPTKWRDGARGRAKLICIRVETWPRARDNKGWLKLISWRKSDDKGEAQIRNLSKTKLECSFFRI